MVAQAHQTSVAVFEILGRCKGMAQHCLRSQSKKGKQLPHSRKGKLPRIKNGNNSSTVKMQATPLKKGENSPKVKRETTPPE